MAVLDCEITLRWVEFEGVRIFRYNNIAPESRDHETFFGTLKGEVALFGIWDGGGEFPVIDPDNGDTDVEQEIPLPILRRVQRQMVEPDWESSSTEGYGYFEKRDEDTVVYKTECGLEYEFDLDDIIELFGP